MRTLPFGMDIVFTKIVCLKFQRKEKKIPKALTDIKPDFGLSIEKFVFVFISSVN